MNEKLNEQKPVAEGLPEMCFTTLPSTGELICIKRGELGYYPSSWNTDDKQRNEELADYNNERLGVTVVLSTKYFLWSRQTRPRIFWSRVRISVRWF